MGVTDFGAEIVQKWVSVVLRPSDFFDRVNETETGQSSALWFLVVIALVSKVSEDVVYSGRDLLGILLFGVVVLLLAPVFLHIVTGFQYLLLWVFTEKDRGVDRTLRSIAYGSAPGVVSWVPVIGPIASLYGIYLVSAGIKEGHETDHWRGFSSSIVPSVLVFGLGFSGFEAVRKTAQLAGINLL